MVIIPEKIISLFSVNDMTLIDIGGRALGHGKEGGLLSISRQGLFFIPAILIMPRLFGIEGIIWAQPMADLLTIALTAVFSLGLRKKLKAMKAETSPTIEKRRHTDVVN